MQCDENENGICVGESKKSYLLEKTHKKFYTHVNWLISSILFIMQITLGLSCKDDIVNPTPLFELKVEDVHVTQAWLRVTYNIHGWVSIKRGVLTIVDSIRSPIDTVISDENLLPKQSYSYKAFVLIDGGSRDSTSLVQIMTIDSTSHVIDWILDTLSAGGSSTFNDVAIINDTVVYAVGEINHEDKDSLGNWIGDPYNFAKWNGHKWEYSTTMDSGYDYNENYAVFAFNENDIWTGGTVPKHWDGKKWTFYGSRTGYQGGFRLRKIWGSSSQNLYVVGTEGNIRWFNGYSWWKIESGTTLNINDIRGSYNEKKGSYEIFAIASHLGMTSDRKILQINGTTATTISDYPISHSVESIWFIPEHIYFLVGSGIYKKRVLSEYKWFDYGFDITLYHTIDVYGTGINDVFFVGSFGDCLHYNGVSYKSYTNEGTRINGVYSSIRATSSLIVAVGVVNNKACVLFGRR